MLPVRALAAEEEDENLLANPTFDNNAEGWQKEGGWTFNDGTATLEITTGGADWTQALFQDGIILEEHYAYDVSVTITSTIDRQVVIGFEGITGEERAYTFDLTANVEKTITLSTSHAGTGKFGIYFGQGDAFSQKHTVTVKDISIVKGERIKAPGEDTEDGPEVPEVEGNLIKNGNFAQKNENWTAAQTNADVYFNQYRTVFYLKGSAADWEQGLKQELSLENGAKYKVSFTVKTDVNRTVTVNLKEAGTDGAYTSQVISANQETEVTFETDGFARDNGQFYLYLGAAADVTYPHSVVISNVSVTPMPVEFDDYDTENDTPPEKITRVQGTDPADAVILKDGNFTQGLAHWETWAEDWINQYSAVSFVPAEDGGMTVRIGADVTNNNGKKYDSARIWTMNDDRTTAKFSQTYGRFEAKIKMPAGSDKQGLWPAFWLLPVDSVYGSWPLSGEIDIMEARGREGNKADGTIHFGRPWPNDGSSGGSMVWDDDPLAITEYHIYSVDWTPEYMSFQVDGEEYYRVSSWYSEDPANPAKYAFGAPFDQPFYIVLNMAVGGTYDGNLEPSSAALPAEMCVDYVRVYKSTDSAKLADGYMPAEPQVNAETIPADAKDSIIDPNFTDVKKVVRDGDPQNVNGWNLLTLESFGGAADFSTVTANDGTVFGKVNITNPGSQNYSVQLTQKLALYTGNWYTLSFDAYADGNHTIIAKIGGDGTNSWSAYNSVEVPITQSVRHYEYIFQMLNDSDDSARLELNMNYATGGVYFANVKLEHAEGLTINHDAQKAPLDDGNGIYNGNFELGTVDRLAYWHATGGQVIRQKESNGTFNHVFKANSGDATVYQTGIELLQSDTYELTADFTGTVQVKIASADGASTYYNGTLNGAGTPSFTMPSGVTDRNATITFTLSSGATLDNVSLIRTTYNNVDYSGLDCYPLSNGDFERGDLGWGTYNTTLTIAGTTEDGHGSYIGQIEGKASANRWDALLSYDNLELLGGYNYILSFDVKASSSNAVIDVALEDASYSRAFESTGLTLGTAWQHFEYTFKLGADAALALKFLVGGADSIYTLSLDNVELKLAGAPARPGAFFPLNYYQLTKAVQVPYIGTEDWTSAATLYLDGESVNSQWYQYSGDNLILDASLFTASGVYTLSATASGFADTKAVELCIYPANGERLVNGGFSNGSEGWETYVKGNSATLDFERSFLNARYLHAEGDEWGNPAVPWAIQLSQYFPADPGTYTLHFYCQSEVPRYIMVGLAGSTMSKVQMTENWTEHTVTLNIAASDTYQLQFFLSAVNPNESNGYFTSGTYYIDFQPHNFYLDSVSILPSDVEYIPSTVKPLLTLNAPEAVKSGAAVTVSATLEKAPMLVSGEEPNGTLTFYLDNVETASSGKTATLTGLTVGEHTVKVIFTPDENEALYEAAEVEAHITVTKDSTSGSTGGDSGGSTGGNNGGNTGGNNSGSTGGSNSGSAGGNNGGNTNGSSGGSTQSGPTVSADGVIGELKKAGDTVSSASIVVPAEAVVSGKLLTAPIEIPNSQSSAAAPEISITVEGSGSVQLQIPVTNVTPGTVAVLKNPDGTETVLRDCMITEGGLVLSTTGNMTVMIVDRTTHFTDLDSVPWARDAIDFASARELFRGVGGDLFDPNSTATRATVVTLMFRLAYEPESATHSFSDVANGLWYSDAIAWAQAEGVVHGMGNGLFCPNDVITREQMAVILYNYAKHQGYDTSLRAGLTVFSDVNDVSPWSREAMEWAVAVGIMQGTGNNFLSPTDDATRAQLATILMRFIQLRMA